MVDWFMAYFLYCFPYRSFNSITTTIVVARSFTFYALRGVSFRKVMLFFSLSPLRATTVGRAITLEKEQSKNKQRTNTKKDAKKIKIENNSNREKSNGKINDWMAP